MKKKLVFALLTAVVMTTAVGCGSNKEVTSVSQEAVQNKLNEYADPNAFVTAEEAKALMDSEADVVVFDIRKDGDYGKGHIEGAVNYFRKQYESTAYEYGGMAVEREGFAKLLGESGATKDSTILVYGNDQNLDSARFAWMLQMYGHENVALIEGGIGGWEAAGYATTKEAPVVEAKTFEFVNEMDASILATLEEVKAGLEDENVIILDTRANDEFSGKSQKSGAFRKGRIPGAVHVEYTKVIDENGFKSKEEIQKIYEEVGVTADKTIIAYCQSGVRSANTTYVLREILGYENVKNYDGSWIEWSYFEELPIEQD
ncbi:MAG: sulfurtransferase [Cellulosilyticaceae bacterium]